MAESVDAPDLGSGAFKRGGSSPFTRTISDCNELLHQSSRMTESSPTFDLESTTPQTQLIEQGVNRTFLIGITNKLMEEKLVESLKEVQRSYTLPGFRKGKTPLNLLRRRIGDDAKKSIISKIVDEKFKEHVETDKPDIVCRPEFEIEFDKQEGIAAKVVVSYGTRPELPELDLEKIELIKYVPKNRNNLLKLISNDFLMEHAKKVPYPSDHVAKKGNWLNVEFFPPKIKDLPQENRNFDLQILDENILFGNKVKLIGCSVGEEIDIKLQGEGDSDPLTAIIKVREIYAKKKGKKTLKLAKQYGFESIEKLNEVLLVRKQMQFESLASKVFQSQLDSQLKFDEEVELPELLVNQSLEHQWYSMGFDRIATINSNGTTPNEGLEENLKGDSHDQRLRPQWDKIDNKLYEQVLTVTKNQIIKRLIFDAVAKSKEIEVTVEEIRNEFEILKQRMSQNSQEREEMRIENLSMEQAYELQTKTLNRKVEKTIVNTAQTKEVKINFEDLVELEKMLHRPNENES